MIEIVILTHLKEKLEVPVYMESPDPKPERYVLIEKTGSGRDNWLTSSTIAVQSYAPSLYEAALLNDAVKTAMDDLVALNEIGKSKLNSDYNYTDTATKQYRYQAVYDINHY